MPRNLSSKTLYESSGDEIGSAGAATEFCFAPGAIVDLVVDLGSRKQS